MNEMNDMWTALEAYQPYAKRHGFGAAWLKMTTERTPDAAWVARQAAAAAGAAAAATPTTIPQWVARAAMWRVVPGAVWMAADAANAAVAWAAVWAADAARDVARDGAAEAAEAAIQHINRAIELEGER